MNSFAGKNIAISLSLVGIAFITGCKPAKPMPVEEKKLVTNPPVAISLQVDTKVEVKVDSTSSINPARVEVRSATKINPANPAKPSTAPTADKIPLKTDLPAPLLVGTPVPINVPNLEPRLKQFPIFAVPAGTINLARGKKVTSSDPEPVIGVLNWITDGNKEGDEGSWVELAPGKQWVQIDLEESADIYAIVIWHFHSQERVYRDVVAQVSDDPAFAKNVATIFDNSATGQDHPYVETYFGKLIDGRGVKGRYVRLYSTGNTTNKLNHYIEVEVFGKPAA